jgi:hypothetical protein
MAVEPRTGRNEWADCIARAADLAVDAALFQRGMLTVSRMATTSRAMATTTLALSAIQMLTPSVAAPQLHDFRCCTHS